MTVTWVEMAEQEGNGGCIGVVMAGLVRER